MLRVFHSSGSRQTYTITMGLYDISLFDVFVLLRWQSFFSDIWGSQAIQISQYQDNVCPRRVFLHRLSVSHTATQWYSNSNTAREKNALFLPDFRRWVASLEVFSRFLWMGRFLWVASSEVLRGCPGMSRFLWGVFWISGDGTLCNALIWYNVFQNSRKLDSTSTFGKRFSESSGGGTGIVNWRIPRFAMTILGNRSRCPWP